MWVVTITATYNSEDDLTSVRELLAPLAPKWDGPTASIEYVFGKRSKYGAARPALEALHKILDSIADSDYYEPWPDAVDVRSVWREVDA